MDDMVVNPQFWAKKRVLLTGHSGFKGSWLALWLNTLNAHVVGISLPPITSPNLFSLTNIENICESIFCDVRDEETFSSIIERTNPDIVFHLAAQSLVRPSYVDPVNTFSTNIMGTINLLEALRKSSSARVAVITTTDKVYKNKEVSTPYNEEDALGGYDPYSASKAATEMVISSYRDAFLADKNIAVGSARAGNVIGGGDWSEDRLIPDAMKSWAAGDTLIVRSPNAVRPWQHVLEPLSGYLTFAEKLWEDPNLAEAYNFGPAHNEIARVHEIIELARDAYGAGSVHFLTENTGPHEAGLLLLENQKSFTKLGVRPRWNYRETIRRTVNWYRGLEEGANPYELCIEEISDYEGAS